MFLLLHPLSWKVAARSPVQRMKKSSSSLPLLYCMEVSSAIAHIRPSSMITLALCRLQTAGSDTTAATIASFVLAMTIHPEIQKKAQEELDRVIGPDRLPTWEDRSQLPYIDAILKETLRWNAATPLGVPHAVIQDDVYEGMFIPGGATVIPNVW